MTVMATGALLLFEQGEYMPPAAAALYPTQAALLVGKPSWELYHALPKQLCGWPRARVCRACMCSCQAWSAFNSHSSRRNVLIPPLQACSTG